MTEKLLTHQEWVVLMTGPAWDAEQLADITDGNLRKAYLKHVSRIYSPPVRVEGETQ